MVRQQQFTEPFVRALKPKATPYKLAEHAARGEGRLVVRVLPNGTREFFYRYRAKGQDKTLALGRYDQTGTKGKTLADIRKEAAKVRRLQRETGDVKEHKRAEERQREIEARRGSLRQLLEAYVQSLRDAGRVSADQVNGIFKLHVIKPFPSLVAAKASDVTPEDVQRILARMVKAGITRQVNKVRSYLGAAFAYGGKADHDPRTVAHDGVLFALKANPVTLVPVIKEYERTGERTLSEAELREYWKALDKWPAVQRAALRFNLALACQRPTQLLRAEWADFDFTGNTLLLRDSKGRGGSRDHLLPLTAFALEQLKPLRELNGDAPPFANDGKRAMVVETLSVVVRKISKALKKKQDIPRFQLRDLRRTAETMLQKMGIDREVRAHLLSHGRSKGVQGKHYERYDFLKEKRVALEKWADHLRRVIDPSGKAEVVAIGKRKTLAA
jgi:integrase